MRIRIQIQIQIQIQTRFCRKRNRKQEQKQKDENEKQRKKNQKRKEEQKEKEKEEKKRKRKFIAVAVSAPALSNLLHPKPFLCCPQVFHRSGRRMAGAGLTVQLFSAWMTGADAEQVRSRCRSRETKIKKLAFEQKTILREIIKTSCNLPGNMIS